jgi:hypothetical protein
MVSPGASYTGTVWMKTNYVSGDSSDGAFVNFREVTALGTLVASNITAKIKTTTDWTPYTVTFTTGFSTRFIVPRLSVVGQTGTGTLIMDAWFDDIVLKPTVTTARTVVTSRALA